MEEQGAVWKAPGKSPRKPNSMGRSVGTFNVSEGYATDVDPELPKLPKVSKVP